MRSNDAGRTGTCRNTPSEARLPWLFFLALSLLIRSRYFTRDMPHETAIRSVIKALSWRMVATGVTATVAFWVTGELRFAAAIGILDTLIKLGAYYGHERLWNRIHIGRARPREYHI